MMLRQLPQDFKDMLSGCVDSDVAAKVISALEDTEPVVSARTNKLKNIAPAAGLEPVPWLPDRGFYTDIRPLFAADPAWHQGLYYVQDASSMIMTEAVRRAVEILPDGPVRYLDACAAPGGKTIAAIEALPAGSAVLANEFDRKRAGALLENLAKNGVPTVAVSNIDGAVLGKLGPAFDIVAVDAPCSGEGMMRKEPEAIRQWTRGFVESCAALQRDILAGVWNALRPGGVLIYSTCTFNRQENEENVRFIVETLGAESVDLGLDTYPGVLSGFDTPFHCYRLMPGFVRGEGLFIAALRKTDGEGNRIPRMKGTFSKAAPIALKAAGTWLRESENYTIFADGADAFAAVPATQAAFMAYLAASLHLLRCGLPLGRIKGKDAVPAWELSFSTAFRNDSMPQLPLDYSAAMTYLHGDSLSYIPDSLPKGFATSTFGGVPLGFIKNIGRRANNLYPEALRLRMNPDALATPQQLITTEL